METAARILLEVGHGMRPAADGAQRFDPGCVAADGTTEHGLNLLAAESCREALEQLGYEVAVTDVSASLYQIGRMAERFDVFVSFHFNAANGRAQGAEALFHLEYGTAEDRRLAGLASKMVSSELGIPDRGPRPARLALLAGARKTKTRGAILVEGFFMDVEGVPKKAWATRTGRAVARAVSAFVITSAEPTALS